MNLGSSTFSSSSFSPTAPSKPASTRKINACDPCRGSKQRCDGKKPCSTCVKKKSPDACKWTDREVRRSAAAVKKKEKAENKDLRSEVDRLQKLVNVLVDARLESTDSRSPSTSISSPRSLTSVPLSPQPLLSPSIEADLAERLFNLTISSFSTTSASVHLETKQLHLIDEVETLLRDVPMKAKPAEPGRSFPFLRQAAPALAEIMVRLSQSSDAALSEKYYWSCTSWFFHPLPEYVYRHHKEAVYSAHSKNEIADPISLSIVLAVLGIGRNCRVTYSRTGGSQEELRSARNLVELSTAALSHSNFLEEPTLDAIRALSLLAIFHLSIAPGDEGTLGFAFTGLAVQASLQMKLNRDPAQLNATFTFRKAEERRSMIHHVYILDGICTASYSRGYILLHARDITAAFPLDLHDSELETAETPPNRPCEETVLTSLIERFKISRYSEQITEELLSGTSLSYGRVLELDQELQDLFTSIHPLYQWEHLPFLDLSKAANELRAWKISIVWITLWREKMRLHRPFLHRSYTDPSLAYSRQACIDAAKGFIVIHACPANLIPAAGFTHKACLACIVLALEIVFDSGQPASIEYRNLVEGALERLEKFAKISIIARRGVKVIRFLLEKAETDVVQPPPTKRSKSLPSPGRAGPPLDLSPPSQHTYHLEDVGDLTLSGGVFESSLVSFDSPPAPAPLTEPLDAYDLLSKFGLTFPAELPVDSVTSLSDSLGSTLPSSSFDFGSYSEQRNTTISPFDEGMFFNDDSTPFVGSGQLDSFADSLLVSQEFSTYSSLSHLQEATDT